jgi:hypothetical protein
VGVTRPGRFPSVSWLVWKVNTGSWGNTGKNCRLIAATRGSQLVAHEGLRESWRDFWTPACLATLLGGAVGTIAAIDFGLQNLV